MHLYKLNKSKSLSKYKNILQNHTFNEMLPVQQPVPAKS